MSTKTEYLNLHDKALVAWMALRKVLWKFKLTEQYYETSVAMKGLTRSQNRMDNEH